MEVNMENVKMNDPKNTYMHVFRSSTLFFNLEASSIIQVKVCEPKSSPVTRSTR